MFKEERPIGGILEDIYSKKPVPSQKLSLPFDPSKNDELGVRPNSASVEDCSLGDSGKGHIVQEVNHMMQERSPKKEIFSMRFNGSRNAGHEILQKDVKIALHQLPVAVIQECATAIMGKGMLVHPTDLATEIDYVESKLGSKLPGNLLIDKNAVVTTDLHSAFETFTNRKLDVGHGTTGSGISQGYASWYEKRALTVADLVSDDWRKKFAKQYSFYNDLMGGGNILNSTEVNALTLEGKRTKYPVGTKGEFLDRLESVRQKLIKYVVDARFVIEDVWKNNLDIPFSFEGAQGGALDPYHGLAPDYTASRPIGRVGIPDSTEGVVRYDEIAMRLSTLKVPYMSSVGSRIPPYSMDEKIAKMYRVENDETGRSTGRDRGIYPIDLVLMRAIKRAAGYRYLAVTHIDSNHSNIPIEVVTHYTDKVTGEVVPYRPYQWNWDNVVGHVVKIPSWDGRKAAKARKFEDLPPNCLQFLSFLNQVLGPVALVTNGPELGQVISFFP